MILTFQYRIKDSVTKKHLESMARAVNFVFNYCNETSFKALRYDSKWLSSYDLNNLTSGSSKELGLHSQTVQAIAEEYATRRKQFKKRKLRWRGKKTLGWIPFKASGVKVFGDKVKFSGKEFRFWKTREMGKIKTGSFCQDARGRWYVNFQCEVTEQPASGIRVIGVDLGCKDQLVCSDGEKIRRENLTKSYEVKLAKAQRARRKRQTTNIHAKIANKRKDWAHKATTSLVKSSKVIVVGDIGSKKLMQTKMAKSVADAGFAQIKSMLAYKAIKHQIDCKIISENGTTVTCSTCLQKTGPSGLSGLSIREWICKVCHSSHDRDVNAAQNILRLGHQTPIGNPLPQRLRKRV
jgi:IS605 OrfB family transposase